MLLLLLLVCKSTGNLYVLWPRRVHLHSSSCCGVVDVAALTAEGAAALTRTPSAEDVVLFGPVAPHCLPWRQPLGIRDGNRSCCSRYTAGREGRISLYKDFSYNLHLNQKCFKNLLKF